MGRQAGSVTHTDTEARARDWARLEAVRRAAEELSVAAEEEARQVVAELRAAWPGYTVVGVLEGRVWHIEAEAPDGLSGLFLPVAMMPRAKE
jgi:hypothetical protein